MKHQWSALALLVTSTLVSAAPEVYGIDNTHSFANFTIRHVVSKASGTFPDIQGKITIDRDDLAKSSVNAVINVASVNTGYAKRDQHLLEKPEYLEPGKFAQMSFVSTAVEATGKDSGILHGKLTLHGVTKEIRFPFKALGFGADPWGGQRVGFEGNTSLKASDYGFGWATKPNGPIGDDIEVTLLIEGIKEK